MTQDHDQLEFAHATWKTMEPYHGAIYFSPEAQAQYAALGADAKAGYFGSRAAALGAAPAELVVATFYNFNPGLVHQVVPAVWETASPERFLEARLHGMDATLRRVLGEDVTSPE
ncbi:hypothetical protein ACFW2E_42075, partial [Streptomyces sp. NPDC058964]